MHDVVEDTRCLRSSRPPAGWSLRLMRASLGVGHMTRDQLHHELDLAGNRPHGQFGRRSAEQLGRGDGGEADDADDRDDTAG